MNVHKFSVLGVIALFLLLFCTSCVDNRERTARENVNKWLGKEILLPHAVFTKMLSDTVDFPYQQSDYKILVYVDSLGCTECKLKLDDWKMMMQEEIMNNVAFLFFIQGKSESDLKQTLSRHNFRYPICFDKSGSLNKHNQFPKEGAYHTFLLDQGNKVLAIGNPIHNPRVKALYMKIIRGGKQEKEQRNLTRVAVEKTSLDLGSFPWQEEQKTLFTLKNVGEHPLIIEGTTTSCDCTTVSYSKESVAPGNEVKLEVVYKAEKPEPFYRTISVYCNTPDAPIELEITGSAVE